MTAPWDRFEAGAMGFDHRAHLQLAFEAVEHDDAATVLPDIERALRRVATAHGHPERYHATLTAFWLWVVQERRARRPDLAFEPWLASNADLLEARALPRRYYRANTLADPVARRVFVLPDAGLEHP
ncbi:MAG: hypothetical protein K0V04_06200 [Deltaproteobacteria bacterium]|nr:hypothetical protein [Deltaproteobacteria bacterium]